MAKRVANDNVTGSLSFTFTLINNEPKQTQTPAVSISPQSPQLSSNNSQVIFQAEPHQEEKIKPPNFNSNTAPHISNQSFSNTSLSESLVNSILNSKNRSSLPNFTSVNQEATNELAPQNNVDSGNNLTSSGSASSSDEQPIPTSSSSSSSSSSSGAEIELGNQIRSLSTSSSSSSSRRVSSTSTSASNSTEVINQIENVHEQREATAAITTDQTEIQLMCEQPNEVLCVEELPKSLVSSRKATANRSKSFEQVKLSATLNASFSHNSTIYLKNTNNRNRASRSGLSNSNPSINVHACGKFGSSSNNRSNNRSKQPTRSSLYLKHGSASPRTSGGRTSSYKSKSESNLANHIKKCGRAPPPPPKHVENKTRKFASIELRFFKCLERFTKKTNNSFHGLGKKFDKNVL